ncbi:MAG: DUF2191 domain-containing protein [Kiritimatiellaeota bacterium]|nr:DUF2191 domain-containing protein [Kiritimatiellota bacterium]
MRTTLSLPGNLLEYVRQRAAEEHRTMASIIEDALRGERARKAARPKHPPPRLPVFGGRGVRPGVNLDSTGELLDRMEGRW